MHGSCKRAVVGVSCGYDAALCCVATRLSSLLLRFNISRVATQHKARENSPSLRSTSIHDEMADTQKLADRNTRESEFARHGLRGKTTCIFESYLGRESSIGVTNG